MAENLGTGVSFVDESIGYNYDKVVFQKQKPPLDTELNLAQEIQNELAKRHVKGSPSGWLNLKPFYTSSLLDNEFYTQDPNIATPEYAIINGMVLYVTNTGTSIANANIVNVDDPPTTGNIINGVILEVWRALLDIETDDNRPDSTVIIDSLMAIDAVTENNAWTVGENGLILVTENGGQTWSVQLIDTKKKLNGVHFINSTVGWVAGNNGAIARTSSGGVVWIVLQSGYTENFNGIHAATHLIAWVVGDGGIILKTVNGVNWSAQDSKVTADLNDVYFYDSLVGWVVGNSGTILKTTDGGANWITLTSGTTQNLNSVFFYDLNFGFAVGDNGTILRSSDGGLSWVNQSGNIFLNPGYTSLSVNYNDITMRPTLDVYVTDEEVTSQFSGSNKNCTVVNIPITVGDGLGTTTNNPADVTVAVNGTAALVDSLDGATGQIILHEAPQACDTVLVSYWYKVSPEIFTGKAWISGNSGTVLMTSNIGAQWVQQTLNTSYDLNGVSFVDQNKGWVAGDFSVMRHTEDGGTIWTEQISDTVSRRVQRVFKEGNVDTDVFLDDEMIHPDTNIETTKRVQIQYKIRVIDNVDPFSYPDAGLGSAAIVALGPNSTGTFAYLNMGATTGDYGVWQAKCSNTVDGFAWAIPMFFVNRRNSSPYDVATNTNGSNVKGTSNIRPDLLTGVDIADQDILDVRRQIFVPSITELLNKNFDSLMNNELKTRFFRQTTGGDSYSVEPLQLDYIVNGEGTLINATLSEVVSGSVTSSTTIESLSGNISASTVVPGPFPLEIPSTVRGLFHPNLLYYSMRYRSGSSFDGKPVPGKFTGIGTNTVTFTFSSKANTKNEDINLTHYDIMAHYVVFSSKSLSRIPSSPQLVENTSGTTDPSFFHRGVFTSETSGRKIEEWDSGISGYPSYTLAYPVIEAGGSAQEAKASSIEVHQFIRLTSTDIITSNQIEISTKVYPDLTDTVSFYTINCVSKVNNITSGFSFKIEDIVVVGSVISITSVSGFPFIEGTIIEVIGMAVAGTGNALTRNGASVNFTRGEKKISPFCYSSRLKLTPPGPGSITSVTFTSLDEDTGQISTTGGIFLGISTTETVDSLTDHFAWVDVGAGDVLTPVTVTSFGGITLEITFPTAIVPTSVKIQAFIQQVSLIYSTVDAGLQIAYNFVPSQTPTNLPNSLTTEIVTNPTSVYISNLGTGGSSVIKEPYDFPLDSLPVNDSLILDDNEYYNLDLFRFVDFSVSGGFVQMPVIIPGSFGDELTLSNLTQDNLFRPFYSTCDKDFIFRVEGIKTAVPRKIFIAMIGRVKESTTQLLKGEYVLIIASKASLLSIENSVGYETGSSNVIGVYRLPNKPLTRI